MKVSDLTPEYVGNWLGYGSELSDDDIRELSAAIPAAVSRAAAFTGLTVEQMDQHPDITIAVLGICNDTLTGNRPEWTETPMNRMSASILAMYSVNYL